MLRNVDLSAILVDGLLSGNRPEDGNLHPSGDLIGPLRHTMLRMAGAPRKPETVASLVRLNSGTLFHRWYGEQLQRKGVSCMIEVSATPGLPEGWAGTADLLVWDVEHNAFVLVDIKTTKGEGIKWIEAQGAKEEHVWQISAYWHAFVNMGFPMYNEAAVFYVPMNEDYKADEPVEPLVVPVTPISYNDVTNTMVIRKQMVDEYLDSVSPDYPTDWTPDQGYITDKLAPPMAREQKLMKNKDTYNVVLVPHWSAMFCPYSDDLCDCGGKEGETKTTKIGEWKYDGGDQQEWYYESREGYEHIEPTVAPKGRHEVEVR